MKPNKKQKKKKLFHCMEITRVKLNPEQAVLACCDAGGKSYGAGAQCDFAACNGGGPFSGSS